MMKKKMKKINEMIVFEKGKEFDTYVFTIDDKMTAREIINYLSKFLQYYVASIHSFKYYPRKGTLEVKVKLHGRWDVWT